MQPILYIKICRYTLLLFGILFGFSSTLLLAQFNNLGSWNIVNLKYNLNNKVGFFAEGQIRSLEFYNQFHYYEYKGGINYKPNKNLQYTLGAGSYQTYKEGGNFELPMNNSEFRLWPQIALFQNFGNLTVEQRYRLELRWTISGFRTRYRYRLGLNYPFGKEVNGYKPFQVNLNNELFFSNNEPYFERNRIQAGLNMKPSKQVTLQIGYLHQFDYKITDETGRDFLVVGFYFDIN